tara:strand:+ start:262 stop:459 length:198 start_codon:yes stop_codon:yes gene_type:complete
MQKAFNEMKSITIDNDEKQKFFFPKQNSINPDFEDKLTEYKNIEDVDNAKTKAESFYSELQTQNT